MTTRIVIDTNVLAVANGRNDEADEECEDEAGNALQEAIRSKVVVIDTEYLVIDEYAKHSNWAGQPGAGDLFFKSLTDNIANPSRVVSIDIGSAQEEVDLFVPDQLLDFDSDDRKWIALYLEGLAESIINAVDSDWAARKAEMDDLGINVTELCPQCLSARRIGTNQGNG